MYYTILTPKTCRVVQIIFARQIGQINKQATSSIEVFYRFFITKTLWMSSSPLVTGVLLATGLAIITTISNDPNSHLFASKKPN
jgi:hypothetical protein